MAKDWKNYAGPKAAEWGIPNSVIQDLSALIVAAGAARRDAPVLFYPPEEGPD
jgi:hypothetical protein